MKVSHGGQKSALQRGRFAEMESLHLCRDGAPGEQVCCEGSEVGRGAHGPHTPRSLKYQDNIFLLICHHCDWLDQVLLLLLINIIIYLLLYATHQGDFCKLCSGILVNYFDRIILCTHF